MELATVLHRQWIPIAILAIPADGAQDVCDRLLSCGIRAILNFAPVRLAGKPDTKTANMDLSVSLEGLACYLAANPSDTGGKQGIRCLPAIE